MRPFLCSKHPQVMRLITLKRETKMSLFIEEEKQPLLERKISFKVGTVTQKLNWNYRLINTDEASEFVDSHVEQIETTDDDDEKISTSELMVNKREWLLKSILDNDLLVEWDTYLKKADKKPVEINRKSLEAVLKRGDIFYPVYRDFMDIITKIAQGQSLTDRDKEIKNLIKSARPGKSTG